jgi:hypothetical protein
MFIYATCVEREVTVNPVKTAEEAVIKMIEQIYKDYSMRTDVIYTPESIADYLDSDDHEYESENLMFLQDLYQKLKNGESLEKLVSESADQELVIHHDVDPLWEVFIRFDDKKKLTAQAYSNVDNDYMYDAVLEYVDEVI